MDKTIPDEEDPQKYHFIQTFKTITISFRVPPGTTPSAVQYVLTDTTIKVSLNDERPIIEGTFFAPIVAVNKIFEIDSIKWIASLHLTKRKQEYWTLLIQGCRIHDDQNSIDPCSQYELGKYFEFSLEQDFETALELYLKAANAGFLDAQKRVALIFLGLDPISKENQCFVKLNPKRGIGYLKMAVKQHESVWAMIQLGNIYAQGFRSIERNPTEAEKWYRKAAHYGDATAMYQLGVLKMETQDIDLSVHWWQKAAERGCAEAYIQLGMLHLKGLFPNEERNVQKAREYFRIAVRIKPSLSSDVPSEGVIQKLVHQQKHQNIQRIKQSKSLYNIIWAVDDSEDEHTPSVVQRRIKRQHELKCNNFQNAHSSPNTKTVAAWSVLAVTGLIAAFALHKFIGSSTRS